MNAGAQPGLSAEEERNSSETSSRESRTARYLCPFLQFDKTTGTASNPTANLPKACRNTWDSGCGAKRLIEHLTNHHCKSSKNSRADLTTKYVTTLKRLPNFRSMNPGDKWRAIYRDIFKLSPAAEVPAPFPYYTRAIHTVGGGAFAAVSYSRDVVHRGQLIYPWADRCRGEGKSRIEHVCVSREDGQPDWWDIKHAWKHAS